MNDNDKLTYSRRAEQDKKRKEIEDLNTRMQKLYQDAIRHVASIPEGQIFLALLMSECGFQKSSLLQNLETNDICVNAMLVNEGIRSLYVKIRQYIPVEHRKEIEYLDIRAKAKEIILEKQAEDNE